MVNHFRFSLAARPRTTHSQYHSTSARELQLGSAQEICKMKKLIFEKTLVVPSRYLLRIVRLNQWMEWRREWQQWQSTEYALKHGGIDEFWDLSLCKERTGEYVISRETQQTQPIFTQQTQAGGRRENVFLRKACKIYICRPVFSILHLACCSRCLAPSVLSHAFHPLFP